MTNNIQSKQRKNKTNTTHKTNGLCTANATEKSYYNSNVADVCALYVAMNGNARSNTFPIPHGFFRIPRHLLPGEGTLRVAISTATDPQLGNRASRHNHTLVGYGSSSH